MLARQHCPQQSQRAPKPLSGTRRPDRGAGGEFLLQGPTGLCSPGILFPRTNSASLGVTEVALRGEGEAWFGVFAVTLPAITVPVAVTDFHASAALRLPVSSVTEARSARILNMPVHLWPFHIQAQPLGFTCGNFLPLNMRVVCKVTPAQEKSLLGCRLHTCQVLHTPMESLGEQRDGSAVWAQVCAGEAAGPA